MALACYRIQGKITAETPLHIGSGMRTGTIKHTRHFIPGSLLRGAFGMSLLKACCSREKVPLNHTECEHFDDCPYTLLYGEEHGKSSRIFFRYAYPLHLTCEGGVYLPTPKTTYICSNPQCRRVYSTFTPPAECENCGKSVKAYDGYTCSKCSDMQPYPVTTSRVTLTSLDRGIYSAAKMIVAGEAKGTLHTIETIEKGASFGLEVILDSECKDYARLVASILEKGLPDEGIGGSKSRGLGKISVTNLTVKEVTEDDLRKRSETIDTRKFSVRLLSPMVVENALVFNSSTLAESARRAYSWCLHEGKPKLPEIVREESRISTEMLSGWSLKEERRRRLDPALSPGSIFRFSSSEHDMTFALSLSALELHAIGSYKPHGCGQVHIE